MFSKVAAKGVHKLGSLPDKQIARSKKHCLGLLARSSDGHTAHGRAQRCLCHGFCICGVVLLAFHERLDIDRRDQSYIMAVLRQLTTPVMRSAASFHRDNAGRERCHELRELKPG